MTNDCSDGSRISRGGGANSRDGCTNLLFSKIFVQNCIKMKKFEPGGGGGRIHGVPLRSATRLQIDLIGSIVIGNEWDFNLLKSIC